MRLYEIDAAIANLVNSETGEIADYEAFAALDMERTQKITNMIAAWKNQAAEVAVLEAEAKRLSERAKVLKNRNHRLKEYISYAVNGQKFKSGVHEIRFGKTPESVRIDGEQISAVTSYLEMHYDGCLRYQKPEINKTALKDLLRTGVTIPGVTLESGVSMRIL